MKNIKKSFVVNITLYLLLVISCNKDSVNTKNKSDFQVFDLTVYNKYKEIPIALNSDMTSEDIIAEINYAWGLKLDLEQINLFDELNENDFLELEYKLSKNDKELLSNFEEHVIVHGFDYALDKFKESVVAL
ncbi:MAG: hypothetical protein OXC61_08265 [Flavobacteriaceae bacterium]|nr:hypothetical protein [Flavobacteriaceae bacterium]